MVPFAMLDTQREIRNELQKITGKEKGDKAE